MASERGLGKGLGKGLGALLGDAALQSQEGGSVSLPIAQVEPGLKQPRKRFDEESLADLADSIRLHGIIQPLTVRRLASGYYQIIAGERRWRAAKLAGLAEVPAVIIEADDRKVIENLQREDLNPMEEAQGYRSLMEDYGLTQEETAQRVGKSRPAVANALRLLALPDAVCQLLEEGKLSAGHARAILAAPAGELQKRLARKVVEEGLSVRQTEALAKRLSREQQELDECIGEKPVDPMKLYRDAAAKELEKLIERSANVLGVNLDTGSAHELALRSRGTPRIANRLLRRVRDWAIVHDLIVVRPDDVKEALALYQIDSEGLDRLDIAVLNAIVRNFNGGPVGLNNLAAMVGEESETVETVCEPYLVREGFMIRTPKGRVATEKAWQHLGITPKDDVSKLF